MVKIPKRGADSFLTPNHLQDGDLAIIVGPPYIQDADKSKFDKERTIITIQLKRTGEKYRWGLNVTSNDRLVNKFGEDGDQWINKEIKIQKRNENVRGQDRSVLYALPSMQASIAPDEKTTDF